MAKQFIIRSGSVPVDSILPKFNDVFPSLVPPNKRKFADTFDGGAMALAGRPVAVTPDGEAQAWSATAVLELTGTGSVKPSSVVSSDARALINAGESGANGEWGATFLAGTVGSFGVIFRGSESNQESFRAVFRQSGEFSLQRTTSTGVISTPASTPFSYEAGVTYTMRVAVSGSNVQVFVNESLLLNYASATQFTDHPRAGIYFFGSDAECLEFVGGS